MANWRKKKVFFEKYKLSPDNVVASMSHVEKILSNAINPTHLNGDNKNNPVGLKSSDP